MDDDNQLPFVRSLLSYSVQKDIDPERLCRLAEIDWNALKRSENVSVTTKQLNDLWFNASQLSNDPLFGLHFGESMQLAALGLVGQLIQTSRSVGEALTQAARFIYLLTSQFSMDVLRADSSFTVQFIPAMTQADSYPFLFRQLADLATVFVLHELDGLVLTKIKPLSVTLPYAVTDRAEYERILRCTSIRQGDAYSLTFDARCWNEPILTANYELQRVLIQQASARSGMPEGNQPLRARIDTFLLANAYLGVPTLEAIAANFNVSSRSLQRRLQSEGVTYQQLTDSVRKSLAVRYLESGQHPVKEISYILGYNELSAFTRAFKRWTGTTPASFRRT